jgi:hypothetical protein
MTRLFGALRALRVGVPAAAFFTVTGACLALTPLGAQAPDPAAHASDHAAAQAPDRPAAPAAKLESIVRLSELNIREPKDSTVQIIVYATGPARVAIGSAELTPLTDTLRLRSLPPITADVSQSDVHIRLLSSGRLKVGGPVSGGRAIHLTASGRHIVLLKGGLGADTITDPE